MGLAERRFEGLARQWARPLRRCSGVPGGSGLRIDLVRCRAVCCWAVLQPPVPSCPKRFTHVLIEAGQGLTQQRWSRGRSAGGKAVADSGRAISRASSRETESDSGNQMRLGKGFERTPGLGRGVEEKTGARNWARRLEKLRLAFRREYHRADDPRRA